MPPHNQYGGCNKLNWGVEKKRGKHNRTEPNSTCTTGPSPAEEKAFANPHPAGDRKMGKDGICTEVVRRKENNWNVVARGSEWWEGDDGCGGGREGAQV